MVKAPKPASLSLLLSSSSSARRDETERKQEEEEGDIKNTLRLLHQKFVKHQSLCFSHHQSYLAEEEEEEEEEEEGSIKQTIMVERETTPTPTPEEEEAPSTTNSSTTSTSHPIIHVLAVDDCLIDRKIVEKLLKTALFKVTTVESGKKALEVLGLNEEKIETPINDHKVDIIFTDYCMPEINGYDLLKTVKEHSQLKSLPVVIVSSEHDAERIDRCLATGAEEFMRKPLKLVDVQRLKSYVNPITQITKTGTKRKAPLDLIPESNGSERRPCIAGVAVA